MKRNKEKGTGKKGGAAAAPAFVMLYAVVMASLVLAVGISIMSIARKQIVISGLGRESQYAFYAANTGTECALFWDFHGYLQEIAGSTVGGQPSYSRLAVFPSPLTSAGDDSEVPDGPARATVRCAGNAIMLDGWVSVPIANGNQTTFTVLLDPAAVPPGSSSCAVVTVTKEQLVSAEIKTTVDARGYNTCDDTSPRRVERGLRYTY